MNEGPHNKLRLGELFYVADAKSRFRHSIDNIFLSFNANFQALQIEKRKNDSFTQFWLASFFFFWIFLFVSCLHCRTFDNEFRFVYNFGQTRNMNFLFELRPPNES